MTAAVEAQYPNAQIVRTETDSDGTYEAHIGTGAGKRLTVVVGAEFAMTGTQADTERGGPDADEGTAG